MKADPKVLFLHGLAPDVLRLVTSCAPPGFRTMAMERSVPEVEQIEAARDADFIMIYRAPLPEAVVRAAGKVQLVQLLASGYDDLHVGLLRELGISCANNGGANSWAVADFAVLSILALYRNLGAAERSTRAGTWSAPITGTSTFEMAGKMVGLVGFGNIARKVARRVQAFDATVQYHAPHSLSPDEEERLQIKWVPLDELFRSSDVVSLHAPLVPATRNLVNRDRLQIMKPGSMLVNTSRGAMIDEAALFDALVSGKLGGAALDAFAQEPVDPSNPLLCLPNVLPTPHCAGTTADTWRRRGEFAYGNMLRVLTGESALSKVHLGDESGTLS